jgi:predicted Fe-S protein YdhL (DUF1289 family)
MDQKSKWCMGCWRTIDEIVAWSSDSDETKKKVWGLIALRKNGAMNHNSNSNFNFNEIDKAP